MRSVVVAGARPQFVKAAALLPALRERGEALLVHSAQHPDPRMVEAHLDGLDLDPPEVRLEISESGRARRLGAMVQALAPVLEQQAPDRVLVVGDTDTTLAAALAADFVGLPVAHVEAGARSGERDLPEERNRKLVDELSDLLFCSTPAHAANLVGRSGVHVVGDVMADVLLARRARIRAPEREPYGVVTLHRAGTADDAGIVGRILEAVAACGLPVVFPKHPRTAIEDVPPRIELRGPLPYLEFLGLVSGARFVATDSGGLQKEAYLLGVPCVTLRATTEWLETVAAGWNVLVGTDSDRIARAVKEPPFAKSRPALYGPGDAAKKIAELV